MSRITGTGSYLPSKAVTNSDLYENLKDNFDLERAKKTLSREGSKVENMSEKEIFDNWAKQVTGISERRIYDNDFADSERLIGDTENMGAEAARLALKSANIRAKNLDFIVFSTFTPHLEIPNPACSLAHLIGAECGGIQVNTACSGFIDGLIDAYLRIKADPRTYRNILVVSSETLSKVTNPQDVKTAVLFADGAGAAVLQNIHVGHKETFGFYSSSQYSQEHIRLEQDPRFIEMGGGARVLRKAIEAMSESAYKALENAGLKLEDIDYIIPHQANKRITEGLIKELKQPKEKFVDTINSCGNTSGASVAIALDKLVRGEIPGKNLEKGDKILMTAVGGGYTTAAIVMEY